MPINGQIQTFKIDRFIACDDDNNTYTIIVQETCKWLVTYDDPGKWVGLSKEAVTDDGESVTRIDDNTYKIDDGQKNIIVRKTKK